MALKPTALERSPHNVVGDIADSAFIKLQLEYAGIVLSVDEGALYGLGGGVKFPVVNLFAFKDKIEGHSVFPVVSLS
jgi:hypothetical protein